MASTQKKDSRFKNCIRSIVIAWLAFLSLNCFAQSVLRLQHINVGDGLSQSSVNYIFQDAHGFMWFATGDGLNRYDGKEFIVYKSRFNDTSSSNLKYRNINSNIYEDKNNRLWMSTDAGISYWDTRHRKYKLVLSNYPVPNDATLIALDKDLLWAFVPQCGYYIININNLKSRFYAFTDKWQTDRDTLYNFGNGVIANTGFWVADRAGLLYLDKYKHRDERMIINDKIRSVYLLPDGHLLLTAPDGIYLYDTGKKKKEFIPIKKENKKSHLQWRSIALDKTSHIAYLGSANSSLICKLNLETHKYEFLNFQNSNINCLYIDPAQNLWIGTEGNGVFKLDIKDPKFSCYTPEPYKAEDGGGLMVKSIYRDDSGKIWLGTFSHGLVVYDPVTRTQKNISFPFSTEEQLINTIQKDSSGSLVVTIESRILWIDPKTAKIIRQIKLPVNTAASTKLPIIYSLLEWEKGHYLVGTNLGLQALKFEHGMLSSSVPYMYKNNKQLNTFVYNLHKENNGTISIGKRNGFTRIQIVNDTSVKLLETGFEGIGIRHFYKSVNSSVLWIASEKGLVAYNEKTKQYKAFDETAGLANSCVYAILAQNDSTLWISTNQGLSRVKVHYGNGINVNAQFTNYTSKDGLQSNEFNTGAFYRCKDGTFIFGGIAGINWFHPDEIKPNPNKAKPAISSIFINDALFATDTAIYINTLNLPYNKNTISLSLSALEFTKHEQNQFAYKLEGLDNAWVYTTNDKVRYSNLSPGKYTFLLKVSNNEGIWNEEPLKIQIVIQPPYWQTWWFRLLIIIFIVTVFYSITRYYVKQKIKTKTIALEKQQALYMERLRISKDMHDDLGSGLSKISLMADMAQKKAAANIYLGNEIKHISTVSKELVDNMRDLIWILNPENTTLEQLVARIRESCADYLEHMPVNFKLDFPDVVCEASISRETQRNIFLTTKEAIHNCIKHAQATEIRVALSLEFDKMTISIGDNGKGFDVAHVKSGGNGLRNMKHRIESIGGTFTITSSLNNSTTINMTMPFRELSA